MRRLIDRRILFPYLAVFLLLILAVPQLRAADDGPDVVKAVTGKISEIAKPVFQDAQAPVPLKQSSKKDKFYQKLHKGQSKFYSARNDQKRKFIEQLREKNAKGEDTSALMRKFHDKQNKDLQKFLDKQKSKIEKHKLKSTA